jgi:site-specific DNA-methyltransferase (adenine-specific)
VKPYYEQDGITIYHADCRDVLPSLPPVDLVLTDPPYNVGLNYIGHDDDMPDDVYLEWCRQWFTECEQIAKRVIVFPGHGNFPIWWQIKKPSGVGCWYKPGNPASGGVFQWCEWEPFLLYGKGIGGSDVFRSTVSKQRETGDHPCPKPRLLMRDMLIRSKALSVLDPFMGSGSTLRAAKDIGITAIGIEIEERYCETAAKRLMQAVLPLGDVA